MTDEAFSRAARTYGDTLFRVAYHALQNRADAEDVMQTVLLRLYESRKEFESEAHLKHWLLRARTRLRKELAPGEEKEESDYVRPQIVP